MLRRSNPAGRQFEDDLRLETESIGHAYLDTYLRAMVQGGLGDMEAVLNGRLPVSLVRRMLRWAPAELPPDAKIALVKAFFASPHFAALPMVWTSTRMFATLKGLVRHGFYTNSATAASKLSGFFYDVKHISTYAPYCDAFFMDDAMRDLVNRPTVDLAGRFGTQLFSLSNLDDFMRWLDIVEESTTEEHKSALALAYPQWF